MDWIANYIDHPALLLLATAIALPVIWLVCKDFFGDFDDLAEDLKDAAPPDWYALFVGRYWESQRAGLKIGVFLVLCFGLVAALYKICVFQRRLGCGATGRSESLSSNDRP
jgi:hypothetical protein